MYLSKKKEHFSYKGDMAYMNVYVSRHLKEELAWAIDKRFRVVSNTMLFKTVTPLRN